MYKKEFYFHNKIGENMKIESVMNKGIIAFEKETPLVEIAKTMKEQDVGMVLIYESKKVIGVLTDRDIVVKILANDDHSIKEYYSKNIITIDKNEDVETAIDKMKEHKIKRLIVTNNKKIVGILSLSDLLTIENDKKIGSTYKEIWQINRNTDKNITKIDEFEL